MRAIIVDDFRLARLDLLEYLHAFEDIKVLCDLEDSQNAIHVINREMPDIIFVDINMPKVSGFELASQLTCSPLIVYTTAYSEYALKAFNHNALDYLLKPICADRLEKTIEKARSILRPTTSAPATIKFLSLKQGERRLLCRLQDIDAFESSPTGVKAYLKDKNVTSTKTLAQIEEQICTQSFFRLSRQTIVNLSAIAEIECLSDDNIQATLYSGRQLKVSRRQYCKLKMLLTG